MFQKLFGEEEEKTEGIKVIRDNAHIQLEKKKKRIVFKMMNAESLSIALL